MRAPEGWGSERPTDAEAKIPAEREVELLERHRPVLRFDPQYDYRLLAAESAVANAGNILRRGDGEAIARSGGTPPLDLGVLSAYPGGEAPSEEDCIAMAPDHAGDARRMEWDPALSGRIYGRAVADGGMTWLQYWFWLYYNPKNLRGFGKHEGDWEMVQIGLGAAGEPKVATYAQHDSGEARPWHEGAIERSPLDPNRPVVYVAPLSHASYFEPGSHPYVLGIDHPYAGGPGAAELPLARFGKWADWVGRWGSTERTIGGRIGSGPRSPGHQGAKWERPAAWHRRMRHRRLRALLGRAMHRIGRLTYPAAPGIEARREGGSVVVRWRLAGRGLRRGSHLYITTHERHFVIASRVLAGVAGEGEATLLVPESREPTAVMASAYNALRQRSDVAEAPLA